MMIKEIKRLFFNIKLWLPILMSDESMSVYQITLRNGGISFSNNIVLKNILKD